MKERPILFSAPMVRAILEGRKTQTRRVMKPQPFWGERQGLQSAGWCFSSPKVALLSWPGDKLTEALKSHCPYGQRGDRLWVRETFLVDDNRRIPKTATRKNFEVDYKATSEDSPHWRWRPSIHMPRWASRITLEITGIRVERLQDISEADAHAEGVTIRSVTHYDGQAKDYFFALWEKINGLESWAANPWVWVIEFKKC